jgi:hypothetical protein
MQTVRATSSTPIIDASVYRAGAPLALVVILVPILAAIGLAVARFAGGVAIPPWAALAIGGWIILTPLFWLLLKTVRVTAYGIATGRIWSEWKEILWGDVNRVEQRGGRIHIHGASGAAISFAPWLLRDNRELRQYLTHRIAPHFIATPLIKPAETNQGRPAIPRPIDVTATQMNARPALNLRLGALAVFALAVGAGVGAFLEAPAPLSYVALAFCALVALAALLGLAWLSQAVNLTEDSVAVRGVLFASGKPLLWSEVGFVEVSPNERVLRLRGERKLRCPGPGLFAQPTRDTYRWLLHIYCLDRGVPAMPRPGVW